MRDLHDGGGENRRDAGIHGVPAGCEQLRAGFNGERPAGGDDPTRGPHFGTQCGRRLPRGGIGG
jgi:hypothetical protein